MHLYFLSSAFHPAVESGRSDGVFHIALHKKPVDKKETDRAYRLWEHNDNVRACLMDRGHDIETGTDGLFTGVTVTYPEVATPANVKATFDNSKPDSPLFPFGETQEVRRPTHGWAARMDCSSHLLTFHAPSMYNFFLRTIVARRRVEASVMRVYEAPADDAKDTVKAGSKRRRE